MGFAAGVNRTRRGRLDERSRTRIGRPLSLDTGEQDVTVPETRQPGPEARAERLPGAPSEGAYQLGAPLGRSEGDVYETTHSRMPGRFAMKLLRRAQNAPVEAIDRFRADVERTAALRHPNITEVLEVGAMGGAGEEIPLVVMERLEGQTLAERMSRRERMALSEVVPLLREAANALEAAHRVGVTHGAVRPDNLFLAEIAGYERGFVKLLDFGVVHLDAAAEGQGPLQDLGADNLRYLAPEQARALAEGAGLGELDPRSDQFGLAAVIYRLLSGQDPFPGSDARLVMEEVKAAALRPLDELCDCDPRVAGVIHRAMARDPGRRYESVLAFAKAFEDAAAPALGGARPTPVSLPGRSVNEPQMPEVTPQVAIHPSLRAMSEPSRVLPPEDGPRPQSFVFKRNSLTQIFFEEGERKEQGNWSAAELEEFQDEDPEARFDSFDELPRRRSRFVPVVLVGGLLIGAGALWLGWRPSFFRLAPSLRPSPVAESEAPPAAPSGPEVTPMPAAPPAAPPATAASGPTPTPVPAAPAEPPPAPASRRAAAEPSAPAAETLPAAPASPPTAAASPPAAAALPVPASPPAPEPVVAPPAAPPPGAVVEIPPPPAAVAPAPAPAPPAAVGSAPLPVPGDDLTASGNPGARPAAVAPEPAPAPRDRAEPEPRPAREQPLRGYVWSPREGRLVPAQ